jgi:hypothetical protein
MSDDRSDWLWTMMIAQPEVAPAHMVEQAFQIRAKVVQRIGLLETSS